MLKSQRLTTTFGTNQSSEKVEAEQVPPPASPNSSHGPQVAPTQSLQTRPPWQLLTAFLGGTRERKEFHLYMGHLTFPASGRT